MSFNRILMVLKNKYQSINPVVKAGFWFMICNVLQRGIQFITTPIVTRLISAEQYGIYSLFMTWMNIFMVFATLNMTGGIYYKGLLKYEKDTYGFTASLQWLSSVCTIIVFVIVTIFYPFLSSIIGLSYSLIILMFLSILFQPAVGFWSAQQRMKYEYKSVLVVTVLSSFCSPIIGIIIVYNTNLEGVGIILGYVLTNVIINGYFYLKNGIKGRSGYLKQYWKATLMLSLPLIPHYLSQIILGQADRIMINYFVGTSEAGIYTLAYQVALVMNIVINGINNAFTPWMYQKLKNRDWMSIKESVNGLIFMFALINILVILIAPEIIMILGTEEYMKAIWIIPPVMLATFVTFVYCTFGTILFYFEDTKMIAVASTVGAAFNIILNAIFIPRFGYIVAGYTTFVSYVIIMILYYILMRKCCKRNDVPSKIFDIKTIIFITIALIIYSILILSLYKGNLERYLLLVLIIIVLGKNQGNIRKKINFKGE